METGVDRVPLNDLSRGLHEERVDLCEAITAVLDSGWLVHGPRHARFESELAAYVGAAAAVGVASGTDALELAITATMPPGRNKVVTTANCGAYTTVAARRAGAEIVYVDIDRDTLLLDPTHLVEVLDETVGVVVVTHLYGRAADVAAVNRACEPLGIAVVEDCAQAIGARTPDGPVGSLGDAAAFSFYPTKNLGALGDAGAVTTSRPELAERLRKLRQYGWDPKYTVRMDHGRNSRLDEVQAAVLSMRLPHLEDKNRRRREIVARYADRASSTITLVHSGGPDYVGHLAVVRCDDRPALEAHLAAAGVQTAVHYPVPDHRQPAFADDYAEVSLAVTEELSTRILSVPVFPELREEEIERVSSALASF